MPKAVGSGETWLDLDEILVDLEEIRPNLGEIWLDLDDISAYFEEILPDLFEFRSDLDRLDRKHR